MSLSKKFNNPWVCTGFALLISAGLVFMTISVFVGIYALGVWLGTEYTITDVSEYGNFEHLPKEAQEDLFRFLPAEISPGFENVEYFYLQGYDYYIISLEFTIPDTEDFEAYVKNNTKEMQEGTFYFDDSYQEYVMIEEDGFVHDHLWVYECTETDGTVDQILDYVRIRKILVNPSEQHIIYVAVSGDKMPPDYFNAFLSRFQTDVLQYEAYLQSLEQ